MITVLFSACEKESTSKRIFCNLEDYLLYPKVIEESLPAYTIEQTKNKVYYGLDNGAVVEAFDTQALGAIETGIAKYWYPQYLATVIIAIDHNQTDTVLIGWNDLLDVQEEVGFLDRPGDLEMLTAAMSYGLEGEGYSLTKAMELLSSLHDDNRLKINSFESPITICYDYQAAALIENGRNIEIIIPKEGTYTYEKGLLSNEPLNFQGNIDQLLLQAKLRLLDGQSDFSTYPNETAYASAIRVTDYNYFAKSIRNVTCLMERRVYRSKRYMSIDNREHQHFALVYIIIITIWVAWVVRRSMQKGISYAAFFTGIILNGWILVRLIKYQIETFPALTRYLWYSFYIFQLSLSLVLLWMAWAIDKPEDKIMPPKWWQMMAVLISLLILLVFTNDLHGLVFHLDLSKADWDVDYSYGWGYYTVLFIGMTNLIAVFIILVQKSIRNPRKKGIVFPFAILFLFAAYTYGYIIRNPFVYETDLTIVTGVFTMLMFEGCIQSGLIPVNTKHIDLFTRSPLKMQIITKEGKVALASTPPASLLEEEDYMLFASPIPGGYAVWQEDVSKLYHLQKEIKESTQMLREANAILAEEEKLKRIMNEENAKDQLMEQLEVEIAENLEELSSRIEKLPQAKNHLKETTRIALLLCYIKRRCNLFFKEKETNTIFTDELMIYIDELSGIARYSNVQIVSTNEIKGSLNIRYGTLFYDFFYGIVDLAVQRGCPYIIGHLGMKKEFFTMRVLPSEDIPVLQLESRLIAGIAAAKGKIITKDLEDTMGISISFPKGGVADD